ncbi:POLG alternative reading frame [Lathamus discolor]|uniref:POLG alternative reading frame n=1 Tax=Lathamus discolor TaxID=678569 RepID=UPI0032B79E89
MHSVLVATRAPRVLALPSGPTGVLQLSPSRCGEMKTGTDFAPYGSLWFHGTHSSSSQRLHSSGRGREAQSCGAAGACPRSLERFAPRCTLGSTCRAGGAPVPPVPVPPPVRLPAAAVTSADGAGFSSRRVQAPGAVRGKLLCVPRGGSDGNENRPRGPEGRGGASRGHPPGAGPGAADRGSAGGERAPSAPRSVAGGTGNPPWPRQPRWGGTPEGAARVGGAGPGRAAAVTSPDRNLGLCGKTKLHRSAAGERPLRAPGPARG